MALRCQRLRKNLPVEKIGGKATFRAPNRGGGGEQDFLLPDGRERIAQKEVFADIFMNCQLCTAGLRTNILQVWVQLDQDLVFLILKG